MAARRFEATADASEATILSSDDAGPRPQAGGEEPKKPKAEADEASSMSALLRAKKRASEDWGGDEAS